MTTSARRYLVIAPCRDEAKFARRMLESVVAQTVKPAQMVIVDDGSTDGTPAILAEYAAAYPWITVVKRTDRGARSVGGGVVEAFGDGLAGVDLDRFDYLCKLDLDLVLPPTYFERLIERMEADPRQGTLSGKAYYPGPSNPEGVFGKELISEGIGDDVSVGASKFFRVACFKQIGGFVRQWMWDGIDCHRCRMLGWKAGSVDDPELRFIHLRPMGSSESSILHGRRFHGFGQWFMGTGLLFMTASAAYRMSMHPFVLGGLAMWWGYVSSMLSGVPRYEDLEFRRFLRRYHRLCLTRGKAAAQRIVEERWASRWNPAGRDKMNAAYAAAR